MKHPTRPVQVNDSLMVRESWKIFQVMAEFVEGYERLVTIPPSVSIFGSARLDQGHPWYELTYQTAKALSEAGFSVVSGGGPGLMEAANKGAKAGPSLSVGLNIVLPCEQIASQYEEIANDYQDISIRFRHFFTRKVMFVKYASAYVVMPGGFGTLDELAEILALVQTGKTRRIPIVLAVESFWQGLLNWFQDQLISVGTIHESDMELYTIANTPQEIVTAVQKFYQERERSPEPSPHEEELMSSRL